MKRFLLLTLLLSYGCALPQKTGLARKATPVSDLPPMPPDTVQGPRAMSRLAESQAVVHPKTYKVEWTTNLNPGQHYSNYRTSLDVSTEMSTWTSLVTLPLAPTNSYIVTNRLPAEFYRPRNYLP